MAVVLSRPWPSAADTPWALVLLGLAAMYLPSYWIASQSLWQRDDHGHAPLILVVALWLFWQARGRLVRVEDSPTPAWGWPLFMTGVLLYLFGRVFTISSVEFLSQIFVVAAIVLLLKGAAALRVVWFAVFYLLFMVPLPATLLDAVTGPLKQWISLFVVDLLYALGYPITRTGVMITIGPYQLLVADACSGLNSMISLSAVGALYMHVMERSRRLHYAIMIAAILPIAFVANIVRVVTLVLITYHLGDEAGQGFLHGAAGIVLMVVALFILFALDMLLGVALHSRRSLDRPSGPGAANTHGT